MGDSTPFPSSAAIKRAERFTRERFVFDGETAQQALASESVRRRALDAALADIGAGLKVPSLEWRQAYSLLLGLERVLSEDEPKLVDGTVLSAHQVDALSGTLAALLAAAQTDIDVASANQAAADAAAEQLDGSLEPGQAITVEADTGDQDETEFEGEGEFETEDEADADATPRPSSMQRPKPKPTRRPPTRNRRTGSTTMSDLDDGHLSRGRG